MSERGKRGKGKIKRKGGRKMKRIRGWGEKGST